MATGEPYQVPAGLASWLADVHHTLVEVATEAAEDRATADTEAWRPDGDQVWRDDDGTDRELGYPPVAWSVFAADHVAKHDPRSVLARVAAEQAIAGIAAGRIAQLPAGDPDSEVLVHVLRLMAYGHRHTIPGWLPHWAPGAGHHPPHGQGPGGGGGSAGHGAAAPAVDAERPGGVPGPGVERDVPGHGGGARGGT